MSPTGGYEQLIFCSHSLHHSTPNTTETFGAQRTPAMAKFLVKAGQPDRLEYALGGKKYLTTDTTLLERGKVVFAETCAHCHSSKLLDAALTKLDPGSCSGPGYLTCWKRYWDFAKIDEFKAKMKEIVTAPDFLKDNYLSTDARIPVTLLRTNACSPLGTNAIRWGRRPSSSASLHRSRRRRNQQRDRFARA